LLMLKFAHQLIIVSFQVRNDVGYQLLQPFQCASIL
jgi:hypothetical protein